MSGCLPEVRPWQKGLLYSTAPLPRSPPLFLPHLVPRASQGQGVPVTQTHILCSLPLRHLPRLLPSRPLDNNPSFQAGQQAAPSCPAAL